MNFKTNYATQSKSGKINFSLLDFSAPQLTDLSCGRISRSMRAIVSVAQSERLNLNKIEDPKFIEALKISPACNINPDIAALAAGLESVSFKQLKQMRAAGFDLDLLFTDSEAAA